MNKIKKSIYTISFLTFILFAVFVIINKNPEFSFYAILLIAFMLTLLQLDKKYKFPNFAIILFSIWGTLHLLGGIVYIKSVRLYDMILLQIIGEPFFILKYDQLMHLYCYFVISIIIYFILKNHLKNNPKLLLVFTTLSAVGIGVIYELTEFFAVIFLGAAIAVGDYMNNLLDFLFNVLGAIVGAIYIHFSTQRIK